MTLRRLLFQIVWACLAQCGAPAGAATIEVTVADLVFSPAEASAAVGDTIRFVNRDFVDHTATAVNGGFDLDLPAGGDASTIVGNAGTFDYFCRFHPDMTGRIIVSAGNGR